MFEYLQRKLSAIEASDWQTPEEGLRQLRSLGLDDFGLVLLEMPDPSYPRLSAILPAMASAQTQQSWTGSSGVDLLRQSVDFVRIITTRYTQLTGKSLSSANTLDYGCGYGRILRLMMYFANPESLYGCDPWDRSIDLCKEANLAVDLVQTDYLPTSLPYKDGLFDYIYAFSVFTHTSERATVAALNALRPTIKPGGMATITIRPKEYWDYHPDLSDAERADLKASHDRHGFSFKPHQRKPIDGDITYGDTTMKIAALSRLAQGWRVAAYDRALNDPYQISIHLRPV